MSGFSFLCIKCFISFKSNGLPLGLQTLLKIVTSKQKQISNQLPFICSIIIASNPSQINANRVNNWLVIYIDKSYRPM